MKTFGNQLLARPALADDEHGPVERRRAAASLDRVEEGEALPDELIRPLHPSFDQKFDRLLVANPTIWQGFSTFYHVPKRRFSRKIRHSAKLARLLYGEWQV